MKICRIVKEQISDKFHRVCEFINDYNNEASAKCKIFTVISIILLIFFTVLNVVEWNLNTEAKNCISDFVDRKNDSISKIDISMFEPMQNIGITFKKFIFKLHEQFEVIALIAATTLISICIGLFKKPGEELHKIVSKEVEKAINEPKMYIPAIILFLIDSMLIVLSII